LHAAPHALRGATKTARFYSAPRAIARSPGNRLPAFAADPVDLGVMERLVPRIRNGRFVTIPAGDRTAGHMT